jgi:16S rRNA (uracil1498-N3)-methyltransferase
MSHRFHVNDLSDGKRVPLPPETVHHLRVLGLAEGSEVVLFDGTGLEVLARIESLSRADARALVLRRTRLSREAAIEVTLACAVPRGPRMDTLVRACAELGVVRLVPLITRRSVAKPAEAGRPSQKMDRWRKISVSASEQSGRNRIMSVESPTAFADFLQRTRDFDLAVVLSPDESAPTLPALLARHEQISSLVVLVGPEGGFTEEESALALGHGVETARLTRSILRVETACIAAAAVALTLFSR